MIDEKDALFIKLQYPDFCKEMVNYAASFIHWDEVPENMNQMYAMSHFVRKYYPDDYDENITWSYSIIPKMGQKYPRTK